MPYVTEFNESRVLSDITTDIDRTITSKDIYHKSLPFFNLLELSKLHDYKRFCQGDIDVEQVYKRVEIIDRKKYVFEGNAPSYHRTEDCPFLNSNFKNIELPNAVKKWEDKEVDRFREWFKKNIKDIEDDELIVTRIKEEWDIVCSVNRVNFRNSGSIYVEDLALTNIEKRIDSLILAQKDYYNQNRYFLARFSKATFLGFKANTIDNNQTGLSDDELKEKLREYHNLFKEPIIHYLKEYYKVKFSKDVEFEEKLLDSLGFDKCKNCYQNKVETLLSKKETKEETKLDEFLSRRKAKKLCRKPSELKANISIDDPDYLEFYYFCKLMGIDKSVVINGVEYKKVVIEYIIDDNIFYEDAYYNESVNLIPADKLILFNGYLVYTKFKSDNHEDFWREMYPLDHQEKSNYYD